MFVSMLKRGKMNEIEDKIFSRKKFDLYFNLPFSYTHAHLSFTLREIFQYSSLTRFNSSEKMLREKSFDIIKMFLLEKFHNTALHIQGNHFFYVRVIK